MWPLSVKAWSQVGLANDVVGSCGRCEPGWSERQAHAAWNWELQLGLRSQRLVMLDGLCLLTIFAALTL